MFLLKDYNAAVLDITMQSSSDDVDYIDKNRDSLANNMANKGF